MDQGVHPVALHVPVDILQLLRQHEMECLHMRRCTVAHQAAAELRAIQLQIGGVLQRAQAPRRLSRTTQTSADVISAADRDFGVATAGSNLKNSRSVSSDGSFRSTAETQVSSHESTRESIPGYDADLPSSSRPLLPSLPPKSEPDSSQQLAQSQVAGDALQSAPSVKSPSLKSPPEPSRMQEHIVEQLPVKESPASELPSAEESREPPADVSTTSLDKIIDATSTGQSVTAAEAPAAVLSVRTSVTDSSDVGTTEDMTPQTPDSQLRPCSASQLKVERLVAESPEWPGLQQRPASRAAPDPAASEPQPTSAANPSPPLSTAPSTVSTASAGRPVRTPPSAAATAASCAGHAAAAFASKHMRSQSARLSSSITPSPRARQRLSLQPSQQQQQQDQQSRPRCSTRAPLWNGSTQVTTRARPAVDRDGFTPVSRHRRQTTPSPTQADKSAVAGLSAGRSAETTSSRDKSPTPQVEATEAHAVDKVVDQSAAPAAEHPDSKQTGNTGQRVDTSDEPATPRHSCDNVAATGTRRSTGSSTGTTTAEIRHPDATSAAAKDGCAKRDLPRDPAQTSAPEHQGDGGDTTGHAADGSAADNAASEAGSEAADAAAGENAAGNFGAATGDAAGAATSTADGKPTDQADGKTIERATGENAAEPADKTPAGTDDEACVKESRPTVAAKDAPAVSIDSRDPSVSTPASLDQVRRDQGPAAPEAGKVPASSTPAADAPVSNAESRPERDRRKRKEKSERQRRARQEKTAKDAADNALLNQAAEERSTALAKAEAEQAARKEALQVKEMWQQRDAASKLSTRSAVSRVQPGGKGKLPITRHPTSLAARHVPKATVKAADAEGETVYTNPLLMGSSSSDVAPEPPSDEHNPFRPNLTTVPATRLCSGSADLDAVDSCSVASGNGLAFPDLQRAPLFQLNGERRGHSGSSPFEFNFSVGV